MEYFDDFLHTQQNDTDSDSVAESSEDAQTPKGALFSIIACFVLFLVFIISIVVIPVFCSSIWRPRMERRMLEKQRKGIERLLVTKLVIPHGKPCRKSIHHHVVQNHSSNFKLKENNSTIHNNNQESDSTVADEESLFQHDHVNDENDVDSVSICHICLDTFQVGDKVSWSENIKCSHVFHNECILQWLLMKHHDCPCCRQRYIKDSCGRLCFESLHPMAKEEEMQRLGGEARRKAVFCVWHGLVDCHGYSMENYFRSDSGSMVSVVICYEPSGEVTEDDNGN